jgi:hypothetical protein
MSGFEARLKAIKLNAAKDGRVNNKGEQVTDDKPATLVIQLEVEEPGAEVLALLGRLSRSTAEIEVELRGYQLEMVTVER